MPHVFQQLKAPLVAALVARSPPARTGNQARWLSSDLLIHRLCYAHPLPTHSAADLSKYCSAVRSGLQR